MSNVLQCATDGAAAMVGKHRGFIALMKKKILRLRLIATHCVIHRQHLAALFHRPYLPWCKTG